MLFVFDIVFVSIDIESGIVFLVKMVTISVSHLICSSESELPTHSLVIQILSRGFRSKFSTLFFHLKNTPGVRLILVFNPTITFFT